MQRYVKAIVGLSVALLLAGVPIAPSAAQPAPRPKIVRFVFAPDPVWDWLRDQGIIEEYERAYNVRVNQIATWDEFTFFAGGHADVTSIATYELPVFEEETGQKLVVFGKYNKLRITPMVRHDNPAQTLADLKGQRIGVPSAVASTLLWGAFAKDMHGLDFRTEGGDFELLISRHQVMPELVMRGDLAACLCIPEMAARYLRTGQMRVLYDEKAAWEIFSERYDDTRSGQTLMGNLFVAREDWFEQNPDVVDFFLDLWQRGLEEWEKHKEEIIRTYPQHFSVETREDIEFMIDYLNRHDWFVREVRLTEEWIEQERKVLTLMKQTGFMAPDAPDTRFEAVADIEPTL